MATRFINMEDAVENASKSLWIAYKKSAYGDEQDARHQQQLKAGKMSVRKRIAALLDIDSFEEIGQLVASPFLGDAKVYTDGVVTGFGTIDGRRVALYAQDFTIKGGSLGKQHAEKICKIMDMAAKIGCPIIGMIDSGGARIDEGIHALAGYGSIFMRNVRYSGVVPQISLVLGPCAGGAAYSPALTDFVFMVEGISQLFITGPQVIEQVTHQKLTKEELGGAAVHTGLSGVAHAAFASEVACFVQVRKLLAIIPHHYKDVHALGRANVVMQSSNNQLDAIVPALDTQAYDMRAVIAQVCDADSFIELQARFAANIVIGLAKIEGITVGVVANQPLVKAGTIDSDASCKAARFIQYCNSFSIPVVSLVDVPGYLPGVEQEHGGIIRHGAKLLYAYAQATVPKITVIIRKAFGGAYIVMGSKELGADFNFAWPQAQVAVLGAAAAMQILHGKKLASLEPAAQQEAMQALQDEYAATVLNPFVAAEYGYIDAIIEPAQTRAQVARALRICLDKVESLPTKKQGNIPL